MSASVMSNAAQLPPEKTADDGAAAQKNTAAPEPCEPEAEPVLGFIAPKSWIGKEFSKIGREFNDYRKNVIHALPGFIVNRGSNLVGATQLVGEGFMFVASGNKLFQGTKTLANGKTAPNYFHGNFQTWLEGKHPSLAAKSGGIIGKTLQAANPVIEPLHNILRNVIADSKIKISAKDLISAKFYKETALSFVDLKKATELERIIQPTGRLVNRWQTRSTFLGMLGMSVSALMPDDKDKPEEVQKLSEMSTLHPLQYAMHRLATAINPLEWYHNKRAFVGLMITVCGICTFLAGFRNVNKQNAYYWNKAHGINGIITATAGSQLILSPTAEQGWGRFGSVMWARMAFLPSSVSSRYTNGDPGRNYYSAGQASFQTANSISFLIGGAEKLPDGTVIDHKKASMEAKKLAKAKKELLQEEKKHAQEEKTHPATTAPLSTVAANDAVLVSREKSSEIAA